MKKTVTVNIGGAFFHVDEDAYEILKKYLETIRGYFINTAGCDEIMADIESRIAEMFKATQSPSKEVISLYDVNNVIAVMGQPEDYLDTENNEAENNSSQTENRNYTSNTSHTKRIFRDPDNRVLGGVCSGVGNYFGIDPVWIRIAFVIMFFAFGTGPFLYLILWIIIPKAKTTAEKLEMRGEPVTAENIGKTIREEMEGVKNSFNTISNDLKSKKTQNQLQQGINRFVDFVTELAKLVFKVAGKLIGLAFIVAALFLTFIFVSLLITGDFVINISDEIVSDFGLHDLLQLIFTSNSDLTLAILAVSLLILVPLVSLMLGGIKLLFNIKHNFKGLGATLGILWVVAILLTVFSVYSTAKDFGKSGDYIQTVNLPAGDTIYISAKSGVFDNDMKIVLFDDERSAIFSANKDSMYLCYPKLDIVKSENDSATFDIKQIARGKTKKIAADRAAGIHYEFAYSENQLVLNNFFTASTNDKFRAQHLNLTLNIPEGKTVYLDKSLENILFDIKNTTNTLDEEMINHYWTMTRNGLTRVDQN
jgi:phage shock protein PspC (stress-responsive transcriptional regulator)